MDLAQFDTSATAEEGVWMALLHPATSVPLGDEETPCQILLVGMDSARFRKATRANADRRTRGGRYRVPSSEELDAEGLELLAMCTLNWQNLDVDGKPFPFSRANAKTLYQRFGWIREQVDRFMGERVNFLPPSVTS